MPRLGGWERQECTHGHDFATEGCNECWPQPLPERVVVSSIPESGKVRSVAPGGVFTGNSGLGWSYYLLVDGVPHSAKEEWKSPTSAKQAMRENVFRLRKKHGLLL